MKSQKNYKRKQSSEIKCKVRGGGKLKKSVLRSALVDNECYDLVFTVDQIFTVLFCVNERNSLKEKQENKHWTIIICTIEYDLD